MPPPTVDEKSMRLLADLPFKKADGNVVTDAGFDIEPAFLRQLVKTRAPRPRRTTYTADEWKAIARRPRRGGKGGRRPRHSTGREGDEAGYRRARRCQGGAPQESGRREPTVKKILAALLVLYFVAPSPPSRAIADDLVRTIDDSLSASRTSSTASSRTRESSDLDYASDTLTRAGLTSISCKSLNLENDQPDLANYYPDYISSSGSCSSTLRINFSRFVARVNTQS